MKLSTNQGKVGITKLARQSKSKEHNGVLSGAGTLFFIILSGGVLFWWSRAQIIYGINMPFVDQWTLLHHFIIQMSLDGIGINDLISQYSESRKLLPNSITLMIIFIFGEYVTYAEYIVFGILYLVIVAIMVLISRKTDLSKFECAAVILLMTATYWSVSTLLVHFFSIAFERLLPQIFLVSGVWLSVVSNRTSTFSMSLIILSVLASLSFISGLALWPLFAFLLILTRPRPASVIAAISLFAVFVGFLTLYLQDMELSDRGFSAILNDPLGAFLFFLKFLGLAFGRQDGFALWGGVVAFLALLGCTAVLVSRHRFLIDRPPMRHAAWLVLASYGVVQGALVTYGRFGTGDIIGRPDLIPHSAFFITSVFGLLLSIAPWRKALTLAVGSAASISIIFTPFNGDLKRSMEQWRDHRLASKACFIFFDQVADLDCILSSYFVYHQVPEFQWDRVLSSRILPWAQTTFQEVKPEPGGRVERLVTTSGGARHVIGWAHQAGLNIDAVIAASGALDDPETRIYAAMDRRARSDVVRVHPGAGERAGFIFADAPSVLVDDLCAHQFYGLDFSDAKAAPISFHGSCESLPGRAETSRSRH